jgi:predicted secreted protein
LVTAWPLIGLTPPIVYPLAFWVTLVAVVVVGARAEREAPETPATSVSPATPA